MQHDSSACCESDHLVAHFLEVVALRIGFAAAVKAGNEVADKTIVIVIVVNTGYCLMVIAAVADVVVGVMAAVARKKVAATGCTTVVTSTS